MEHTLPWRRTETEPSGPSSLRARCPRALFEVDLKPGTGPCEGWNPGNSGRPRAFRSAFSPDPSCKWGTNDDPDLGDQ